MPSKAQAILAAVPLKHLESGFDVCRARGSVIFGSDLHRLFEERGVEDGAPVSTSTPPCRGRRHPGPACPGKLSTCVTCATKRWDGKRRSAVRLPRSRQGRRPGSASGRFVPFDPSTRKSFRSRTCQGRTASPSRRRSYLTDPWESLASWSARKETAMDDLEMLRFAIERRGVGLGRSHGERERQGHEVRPIRLGGK